MLSLLPELMEHWIDVVVCLVYIMSRFGTCQHDLAAGENQQHDLGIHHLVDQSWEKFWLIVATTELLLLFLKCLKLDAETNIR